MVLEYQKWLDFFPVSMSQFISIKIAIYAIVEILFDIDLGV